MFLFSPSLSLFRATSRSERPARSTMHQPRKSSFFEGLFLLRPMARRFSGFGTSFGGRQTLRQHPERNPGVRAIWNTQTAVFRTCEAKRQEVVWSHTDEILKIAYIPIYGPKTHSSFIFEAKSKACSKAIIMRAPLLCETCCNDQGVCHILQWAPSYLAMPKRCSTCMPFLGKCGFCRSSAQTISTTLSIWGCWTLRMSMKRQFLPTSMKMKGVQLIEAIGRLWQLLEQQSGEDGLQLGHGNASCQTEPHGTTRKRQAEPVPAGSSEPGSAGTRWAAADAVHRPQRWALGALGKVTLRLTALLCCACTT